MAEQNANPYKVNTLVTGTPVRLSHVSTPRSRNHLFIAEDTDNGGKSYGCTILIPKSDTKLVNEIKQKVAALKQDPASKQKWGRAWNDEMRQPLRDGDNSDLEKYPERKDHYFMSVTTYDTPPGVLDENRKPVTEDNMNELYSGCWAHVTFNLYAYKPGSKGIAAGLGNVMKAYDDESFGGGGASAEDDFGPAVYEEGSADADFLG